MQRRRDRGSTHTLEAFVTLTFMFVAVVSVTSFTHTDTFPAQLDRMLTVKAQDTLNIWDDLELPVENSCDPTDRLDKLVFDGIMEDHTLWNKLVDAKFGPGYDVDLVLDNYDKIYPLHGSGRVMGSTAALDWSRDDTYTTPLTEISSTSGSENVRFDAPAIHWGHIARPLGEAVRYQANFSDGITPMQRVAWGLTGMRSESPEDNADAPAAVRWRGTIDPLSVDLTGLQLSPAGQAPLSIFISIGGASATEVIPAGVVLNVTFPAGWHRAGWVEETLGPWVNTSPDHVGAGNLFLTTRLASETGASSIQLRAYAPTDAIRPYDIITAQLSHGSLAESNLVVTFPVDNPDHSTPRVLAPTTPYAVRVGSQHVFGAALANGGIAIDVKDFSIEIPGGYDLARNKGNGAPLFAGVVQGADKSFPASGWSASADHKRISWHGNSPIHIEALKAQSFWVTVQLTSDATYATSIQPVDHDGPNVTLSFPNDYKITSRTWGKSPGVVSFVLPPATRGDDDPLGPTADGYAWATAALPGETREYVAKSRGVMAHVDREATYELDPTASDAVNMENAVANASFEVRTRKVPVGSMMRVDGDLSSLLAKLSQLGIHSTLTLELYSPPSLGCVPTAKWDIDTEHMPTPGIDHVVVWDGGLPTPSVFLTTMDNLVYRLDITGEPVWSIGLQGKATALVAMERATGSALLVAGDDGSIRSLDPSDGSIVWTNTFPRPDAPVVHFDAARDLVIAAAGTTFRTIDAGTGTTLHEIGVQALLDITSTSDGVYARDAEAISFWDDTLAGSPIVTMETTGMLATDSVLVATTQRAVMRFEPTRQEFLGSYPLPADVSLATRAFVTSDAVEDLVLALDDETVFVIDGTTGLQAWTGSGPQTSGVADFPMATTPSNDIGVPQTNGCVPGPGPLNYATTYTCGNQELGAEATVLGAGSDLAALGIRNSFVGSAAIRRSQPEQGSEVPFGNELPTAIGVGAWLTNERAVAIGTSGGQILLLDDASNQIFSSAPSDRAGQFSFYMVVPEGGFYGTHLLVARLAWNDATGQHSQEARLLDWFEVVAQDGTRMPRPHYRVALSIAQRDDGLP